MGPLTGGGATNFVRYNESVNPELVTRYEVQETLVIELGVSVDTSSMGGVGVLCLLLCLRVSPSY